MRIRPGKGSRPRTRRRPAHDEAVDAFVVAVDRGRYRTWVGDREVTAMKARELGRGGIVVGDNVRLSGDVSGRPDTLARVVRVAPRRTALRRSADDTDPVERIMIANADQLVIVTALADPPPRPRLIDRFLVAALDAGLEPLLCLTKADLASPAGLLAAYEPLGIAHLVTARPLTEAALDELRAALRDRVSVLVGHSGVGKSTLFNALVPDASRAIGTVSAVTGRAGTPRPPRWPCGCRAAAGSSTRRGCAASASATSRPTTSSGPSRTWPRARRSASPGCSHNEPGCALDAWVAEHGGPAGPAAARLDSLRRLLRSREGLGPAGGDDDG